MKVGRNAGITGIVDISGLPQFRVRVYAFASSLQTDLIDRTGPQDLFRDFAQVVQTGELLLQGEVQAAGYPVPASLRGAEGLLTLQFHDFDNGTIAREVVLIQIGSVQISASEQENTGWKISISARIIDADFSGWPGSQQQFSEPAFDPKETAQGRTKTYDPNQIRFGATQRFHVLGINGGDDADELADILAMIASAIPPFDNLKLRPVQWERLDYYSGVAVLAWGPTDTVDDEVLPRTTTRIDPNKLTSEATTAAVNATPPAPADVSQPWVARETQELILSDQVKVKVTSHGLRSTADDITMPGTWIQTSPGDIENKAQETILYDLALGEPSDNAYTIPLPANTKLVADQIEALNAVKGKKVYVFGPRTPEEEIEWLRSRRTTESGQVRAGAVVVEVTQSSTPDPAGDNPDPSNLELYWSESHRLTDSHWVHTHEFRPLSAINELIEQASHTASDPAAQPLVGDAQRAIIDSNSVAPTPPAVSGRVCVRVQTQRIGVSRWRHVYSYNFRSNADELVAKNAVEKVDRSGLDSEQITAVVYTSGNPPSDPVLSGYTLVEHEDRETANPSFKLRIYRWSLLSREQKIEHDGTSAQASIDGARAVNDLITEQTLVDTCLASDGPDDLLLTQVAALNADTARPWLSAAVRKLNTTRFAVEIRRPADDKQVIIGPGRAGWERFEFTDKNAVYVKVAGVRRESTGRWSYHIEPITVWRVRQRIGLVRYYRTDQFYPKLFRGLQNTRSSTSFLGHPALTMAYQFTETNLNWAEEGSQRWIRCVHWFEYDSFEHVEGNGVPIGVRLTTTTSLVNGGTYSWSADLGLGSGLSLVVTPVNDTTYDASFLS